MSELAHLDATAQAELVRDGEISATELVESAIERIQKLNPELNAVIHERFDKARDEAALFAAGDDRMFSGVPFVHKDLDGWTEGDPYHAGGRFLKEAGFVAPRDSFIAARLKAAGFVLVGKTNTPELGLVPSAEPDAYGPTRNPWDTERSAGGSSGGSAAAVAAGMVAVGHAGDGGGSIRIPASECGLVGLKPSRGRVSLGPDEGEDWSGFVQRLVVTRTVRDTAAVLDVLAGLMPGDPYGAPGPDRPYSDEVGSDPEHLRVGILAAAPGGAAEVDPECVTAVEATGVLLESLGHTVEAAFPAALEETEMAGHFSRLYGVWTADHLDEWGQWVGRPVTEADVEPGTWLGASLGRSTTGTDFWSSERWLQGWTRRVVNWWSDYDILVTPTIPEPPPVLGSFRPTPENGMAGFVKSAKMVSFTVPWNVTGQPAVSLPLYWTDDGLPVGVQFVANQAREDVLIRLASQLEEARPWHDRRPPVSA